MLLTKYEPKHEIVTFDGDTFYFDSKNIIAFQTEMNSSKFIRIGETLVATSTIKIVRPARAEISLLEKLLTGKPEEIKRLVREKVKQRDIDKLTTTEAVILNIISKFENQQGYI